MRCKRETLPPRRSYVVDLVELERRRRERQRAAMTARELGWGLVACGIGALMTLAAAYGGTGC